MPSVTDIKKGSIIQIDGTPYRVVQYNHSSMARGGAVVRTKLRNLYEGSVLDKTFSGNDKVDSPRIDPVDVQYLYQDDTYAYFMRLDTYEQIPVSVSVLSEQLNYMTEGMEVPMLCIDGQPINIELPAKIELEVTWAEPGAKGDTATKVMKQCQVETGLTVSVPIFVRTGDKIKVDTRTGKYVERV
jgi:elongation factor P